MTDSEYAQCGKRAHNRKETSSATTQASGRAASASACKHEALCDSPLAANAQGAKRSASSAQKRGVSSRNGSAKASPTRSSRARKAALQAATPAAKNPADRRKKIGVRNKQLGNEGENLAANFLVNHGYEIIARNWSCMAGEADIIVRDVDTLVFVEVKTRKSVEKGLPSDAVDQRKRAKYERIATYFTQRYEADSIPIRFDVVSVLMKEDRATVRHHINAFGAA